MKEFHLESIAGVVSCAIRFVPNKYRALPPLPPIPPSPSPSSDNIDPVVSPFASSAGGHLSNNEPPDDEPDRLMKRF